MIKKITVHVVITLLVLSTNTTYSSQKNHGTITTAHNKNQLDHIPDNMVSEQYNVQSAMSSQICYEPIRYPTPYQSKPRGEKRIFAPEQLESFMNQRSAIITIISKKLIEKNMNIKIAKREAKKAGDRMYQHLRRNINYNPKKRIQLGGELNEGLIQHNPVAITITINKIIAKLQSHDVWQQSSKISCNAYQVTSEIITSQEKCDESSSVNSDGIDFLAEGNWFNNDNT